MSSVKIRMMESAATTATPSHAVNVTTSVESWMMDRNDVVACECGFTFVPSFRPDAIRHRKEHAEYLDGVRFQPLSTDEIVANADGLRITVVRPHSPLAQRKRAARIGRRANRETRYDFGVYEAQGNSTFSIHAFIGWQGEHAVAFMLLERRGTWRTRWADLDVGLDPQIISEDHDRWTVGFLWVLPRLRRKGIARSLLHEAQRFTGIPILELGWYPPFTPEGKALVRSVCSDEFLIVR
jgi:ribosomal protein S18 acetylase RimI-like enzyme